MPDYNKLVEATRRGQVAPQDKNIPALYSGYTAGRAGALEETRNEQGIRKDNLKQILTNYTPYKENGSPFSFDEMNNMMNSVMQGGNVNENVKLVPKGPKGSDTSGRQFLISPDGTIKDIGATGVKQNKFMKDFSEKVPRAGGLSTDKRYKILTEKLKRIGNDLLDPGAVGKDEKLLKQEYQNIEKQLNDYIKGKWGIQSEEYKTIEKSGFFKNLWGSIFGSRETVPQGKIAVIDPSGNRAYIDKNKLGKALKQGFKRA